jgi:hypothetical protein
VIMEEKSYGDYGDFVNYDDYGNHMAIIEEK